MRIGRANYALLVSTASPQKEGLSGKVEMVKRRRVLFAGQVAALEVEKFVDNDVEDIFDAAAIDSFRHRATMLKLDLDELSFYDCFTSV